MKTSLGLLNGSKVGSSGLSNLGGIFQRKGRCKDVVMPIVFIQVLFNLSVNISK